MAEWLMIVPHPTGKDFSKELKVWTVNLSTSGCVTAFHQLVAEKRCVHIATGIVGVFNAHLVSSTEPWKVITQHMLLYKLLLSDC